MSFWQRIGTFLVFQPPSVESWKSQLHRQASYYGLQHAEEVEKFRDSINELVESWRHDELGYFISQVDPYLRVRICNGVVQHHEPKYESPVLLPSTVLDYHLPHLRRNVNVIVVARDEVHFSVGKKRVATYFSRHSIPDELAWSGEPSALQLITDYTGLQFSMAQSMRMDRASFEKRDRSWSYEIL